jgi:hypothetical protein
MAPMRRLFAALLITSLGLLAPLTTAKAADLTAADRAAHWLTTQVSGGALDNGFDKVGASADGLIALAAADDPAFQPTIDALLATVEAGAAAYASSGGGAAAGKLAIVAAAYGIDPTNFGGVDLVAALKAGVASDGSVGPYPSAFTSGLAMAGFKRAKATEPSTLTTWLLTQQNSDGGFGYAAGATSDADDTALAIIGLLTDTSAGTKTALGKAVAWAAASQKSDGSWAGYVPVNSTCVLAESLQSAGVDISKAESFVASKQLANGAITLADGADIMATSQCLPLLGGVSYLDATWTPKATTAPGTSLTTSSTTTKAHPTPATVTATTVGRGVPALTGADEGLPLLPLTLIGGGLVAGAAGVAVRRRA